MNQTEEDDLTEIHKEWIKLKRKPSAKVGDAKHKQLGERIKYMRRKVRLSREAYFGGLGDGKYYFDVLSKSHSNPDRYGMLIEDLGKGGVKPGQQRWLTRDYHRQQVQELIDKFRRKQNAREARQHRIQIRRDKRNNRHVGGNGEHRIQIRQEQLNNIQVGGDGEYRIQIRQEQLNNIQVGGNGEHRKRNNIQVGGNGEHRIQIREHPIQIQIRREQRKHNNRQVGGNSDEDEDDTSKLPAAPVATNDPSLHNTYKYQYATVKDVKAQQYDSKHQSLYGWHIYANKTIGNHSTWISLEVSEAFLNAVTEFIPVSVFPSELNNENKDQDEDAREQLINNIRDCPELDKMHVRKGGNGEFILLNGTHYSQPRRITWSVVIRKTLKGYDLYSYSRAYSDLKDWRCRPMPKAIFDLGVLCWQAAFEYLDPLSQREPPNGCQYLVYHKLFNGKIGKHRDNQSKGEAYSKRENSQLKNSSVMTFSLGDDMIYSIENGNINMGIKCGQKNLLIWRSEDDASFYHQVFFDNAAEFSSVRHVFVFRWLGKVNEFSDDQEHAMIISS